ncbi:MAG: hypothetical protein AABX01_05660 [Candidatus Micrarchaeota archaeon]
MVRGIIGMLGLIVLLFAINANAATFNVTRIAGTYESGITISDLIQTPDRIYPGDEVRLQFNLQNVGGEAIGNVEAKVLVPFLSQTSNYFLDDLAVGAKKGISVNFKVQNATKPGNYDIYVYAQGASGGQAQVAQIQLTIYEPQLSNALIANVGGNLLVFSGDTVKLPITIRNVGARDAQDVIVQMQYTPGNVLLPIGSDRKYIEGIALDSEKTIEFDAGISPSADPGYYPITLLITYKVDKVAQPTITQTFGIKVESNTDLLVSADTSSTTTSATGQLLVVGVANVGDTPVRGVFISAESDDFRFSGASEKFFGTLNLDDSVSMSLSLLPMSGTQGAGKVYIKVSYKDSLNAEHIQQKEFEIGAVAGFGGIGTGNTADGITGTNQRFGRNSQQFTILGIQPIVIGGILILLVAAFFGYKWYRRRHK